MKKFVLVTKSESGDYYTYFIEHPQKPTIPELREWLLINGSDKEDGYCFEHVVTTNEIIDFKKI